MSSLQLKKYELVVFYLYPVVCYFLSHQLKLNAFASVFLFYGLPAFYLSFRSVRIIPKALYFSLATGIPFIIAIDCMANINLQWIVPDSIIELRFFRYVAIEVILWAVLNIYFVIVFYEYFTDNKKKKAWNSRSLRFSFIIVVLFTVFTLLYLYAPHILKFSYFYLWWGTLLLFVPLLVRLATNPDVILDYLKVGLYFFLVTLTYEIAALQLEWWDFPGTNFIGWISLMGVRFPLEELIFWIILFSMAVLAHYEYFYEK